MSDSSTGQIVGGIVGAVTGFFVGGPAGAIQGASIGYGIGGAIDPPDGPLIKAPRLDDASFQSSSYGVNIPTFEGSVSLSGNVIYLEDNKYKEVVTEEEQDGKGGGGGATVESVEYFATFAVSLHEAKAGAKIRRIRLGGSLFYDIDTDDAATVIQSEKNAEMFRYYDGSQTEPDSRIESKIGTENAQSYEGTAYIIFYDLPLKDYGNGLQGAPVEVELTSNPSQDPVPLTPHIYPYVDDGDMGSGVVNTKLTNDECQFVWSYADGQGSPSEGDYSQGGFLVYKINFSGRGGVEIGDYDGDEVPTGLTQQIGFFTQRTQIWDGVLGVFEYPNGLLQQAHGNMAGVSSTYSPTGNGSIIVNGIARTPLDQQWSVCTYPSGAYSVDDFNLNKWSSLGVLIQSIPHGLSVASSDYSRVRMYWDDGKIYVGIANAFVPVDFYEFDDSGLIRSFSIPDATARFAVCHFAVESGVLMRSYVGFNNIVVDRYRIAEGSESGADLGEVVSRISNNVGVSDIDVSEITGINVRGYRYAGGTARAVIGPLQTGFLFDVIESGYGLAARLRDRPSAATVLSDDLGAHDIGSQLSERISRSREMDDQLPSEIKLNYLDPDREYETNTQIGTYHTTAVNQRTIDLAVVFDSTEAAELADTLINLAWIERYGIAITLPQKYSDLLPCDVITVPVYGSTVDLRIRNIDYNENQSLSLSCVPRGYFNSSAVGSSGTQDQKTVPYLQDAQLLLMNLPMMQDSQDSAGFGAVMWGGDGWGGGYMYRSNDGGETYTVVKTFEAGARVGVGKSFIYESEAPIGDNDGYVVDEISEVEFVPLSGEFESYSEAQVYSGKGWVAYGVEGRWEIMRYTDVAPASGRPDLRVLSGLIRGCRGTEWAAGLHEEGDYLVLLDDVKTVGINVEAIGAENHYKAVTKGLSIVDIDASAFTCTSENLVPFSPVLATGDRAGNDWNFSAERRTRYQSSYWTTGSVPPTDSPEIYRLKVYLDDDFLSVVRVVESSALSFSYTEAQQIEDFGTVQESLSVGMMQVSPTVGEGREIRDTFLSSSSLPSDPHRYWRVRGITVNSVSYLYLGELHLSESDQVDTGTDFTSNYPDDDRPIANMSDGIVTTHARWVVTGKVDQPDFEIRADFGAGNEKAIRYMRQAAYLNQCIVDATFEYSDNGIDWLVYGTVSGLITPASDTLSNWEMINI